MSSPSMNWAFNTILWALRIDDGTLHDLRRTGSTLMTSERLNVSPFIRSKVLAHYDSGGGAQVSATRYDANSYVREKREALEKWQRLLGRIVGIEDPAVRQTIRFGIAPRFAAGFLVWPAAATGRVAPDAIAPMSP